MAGLNELTCRPGGLSGLGRRAAVAALLGGLGAVLGRAKPAAATTIPDNTTINGSLKVAANFTANGSAGFGGAPMVLRQIAGNNGVVVTDENGTNRKDVFLGLDPSLSYTYIQGVQEGVAFLNTAINPGGGNVGIGTVAPTAKLEVDTGGGTGILASSPSGDAVLGLSQTGAGVSGGSTNEFGVFGSNQNNNFAGVSGSGLTGVFGSSSAGNGEGILGIDNAAGGAGVRGVSQAGTGVVGSTSTGLAAAFLGPVVVTGNLSKGGGSFRIDHPLDPLNKFLEHSFVESPDMKNIYDGVATLDARGEALVALPAWFGALNRDFRYQLTALGAPAPGLHISEEIVDNHFKIAGGAPGVRVSWQITGIRQDPYANLYRIAVEEDKPPEQRGTYLHPQAYGKPVSAADLGQRDRDRFARMQDTVASANENLRHQQP